MRHPIAAGALPIKRDVGLAYRSSLLVALVLAVVSVAGLIWGSGGLYSVGSPLVQVSRGGDAANLVLGLPALLGSMWLARRGSLVGLLLWPGALFYVLYADALYLVGAPFSALFFGYVALVTLSTWTLISIVASIDGEEVRRPLAAAPARSVGGALVLIAILAYAGLTAAAAGALGSTATEPAMRPQWVIDYAVGTPPARIVVAVDPPVTSNATSDACGIIVAGLGEDGRAYILADRTIRGREPTVWARAAIAAYRDFAADRIVAEVNQGGDLVVGVMRQVDASVPIRAVRATRGKWVRAEPVSALYAEGRVIHVGEWPELESQMCAFGADGLVQGKSPDRLDALVWALTDLMLTNPRSPTIRTL